MSKYCILSTDSNPEYFNLLPLVCHSWNKIGYKPVVYVVGEISEVVKKHCDAIFISIPPEVDVKDSTLAQLSRLSQCMQFNDEDILITSDADMVIAKDIFWEAGDIVSYGHDLTGYGELPICYVKATAKKWRELMGRVVIPDKAYSDVWEDYWSVDQQMLTDAAKKYGYDNITFVKRGNDNSNHGLPIGRWDRYKWENIPTDIIDVHMKRNDWEAQRKVFSVLWPNEVAFFNSFISEVKGEVKDESKGVYMNMDALKEIASNLSDTEKIQLSHEKHTTVEEEVLPVWINETPQQQLDKIAANDRFGFLPDTGVWGSHRPLLFLALELTDWSSYPVAEYGSGFDSTKFIKDYCDDNEREFVSYDYNKEWAEKCNAIHVRDWDNSNCFDGNFSVCLVDNSPGESRKDIVAKLKGKADIIVVHDSEFYGAGDYKLEPILSTFKYRINYNITQGGAGTSAVSDKIDLTVFDNCTLGKYLLEK